MSKETKKFNLSNEAIIKLAAADVTAFQANRTSYKLNNWLKDELVIRAILNNFQEVTAACSCKAFAKIAALLGLFREQQVLAGNIEITIQDRETVTIKYTVNLDDLNNRYRRYLNTEYSTIVNLPYMEEKDEYEDIDTIQHSFV